MKRNTSTHDAEAGGSHSSRHNEMIVKFIRAGDTGIVKAHDKIAGLQYAVGLARHEDSSDKHARSIQGAFGVSEIPDLNPNSTQYLDIVLGLLIHRNFIHGRGDSLGDCRFQCDKSVFSPDI